MTYKKYNNWITEIRKQCNKSKIIKQYHKLRALSPHAEQLFFTVN